MSDKVSLQPNPNFLFVCRSGFDNDFHLYAERKNTTVTFEAVINETLDNGGIQQIARQAVLSRDEIKILRDWLSDVLT